MLSSDLPSAENVATPLNKVNAHQIISHNTPGYWIHGFGPPFVLRSIAGTSVCKVSIDVGTFKDSDGGSRTVTTFWPTHRYHDESGINTAVVVLVSSMNQSALTLRPTLEEDECNAHATLQRRFDVPKVYDNNTPPCQPTCQASNGGETLLCQCPVMRQVSISKFLESWPQSCQRIWVEAESRGMMYLVTFCVLEACIILRWTTEISDHASGDSGGKYNAEAVLYCCIGLLDTRHIPIRLRDNTSPFSLISLTCQLDIQATTHLFKAQVLWKDIYSRIL